MPEPPHICRNVVCRVCMQVGMYANISSTVDKVSQDIVVSVLCGEETRRAKYSVISGEETRRAKYSVISGEETSRGKYFEMVFEKSREAIYGEKYKKEGQMEREKFQESSDRQMERTRENSEGQMVREKSRESIYGDNYKKVPRLEKEMQGNSEGQMEREKFQESSHRQMEGTRENSEGQMVREKSRESIYGDNYKKVPRLEKEMQGNSEGQMEREKFQESSDRQMEGTRENSESQMVTEKSRESIYGDDYKKVPCLEKDMQGNSEGQMEREKFQESSERRIEKTRENSEGQMVGEKIKESSERQMERAQYFEMLNSLEELKDFMLKCIRVFHYVIRDPGKSVEFYNFSVSEDFRLSLLDAMNAQNWEKVESLIMPIAVAFPGRAAVFHAFFMSAAVLLSMVYQYLQGVIDRGGGKTYSSGSLEFRSTYISIVLFQGAYVWIKFRDVASVRPSSYVNKEGVTVHRYEPRFKPQGSKNYVPTGSYANRDHAVKVYNMCAFYYGKVVDEGILPLGDDTYHPIPPMTDEDLQVTPEEAYKEDLLRIKVGIKVKKVWADYLNSLRVSNGSVVPPDQHHAQHPPCGDRAPGEQPPDPSGALVDDCGDGARAEQPPDPSGAPDEGYGNGAPGEQPPDSSGSSDEDCGDGAPGEQPPDPQRSFHGNSVMEFDDLSSQREVNELRRKNELLELELKHQTELFRLQEQHNNKRIEELEGELARRRSKECSCKRSRTRLT